jgi:hypothetical protein
MMPASRLFGRAMNFKGLSASRIVTVYKACAAVIV